VRIILHNDSGFESSTQDSSISLQLSSPSTLSYFSASDLKFSSKKDIFINAKIVSFLQIIPSCLIEKTSLMIHKTFFFSSKFMLFSCLELRFSYKSFRISSFVLSNTDKSLNTKQAV
jgi:hypothetical protein